MMTAVRNRRGASHTRTVRARTRSVFHVEAFTLKIRYLLPRTQQLYLPQFLQ